MTRAASTPASGRADSRRVLLVEGNAELAAGVRFTFEEEGLAVEVADHGERGLELLSAWRPDVLILDLMLPDIDGFEVLRRARAAGNDIPIMVTSARDDETDRVRGFRLDADQYIPKPFGLLDLLERTKSVLRRSARLRGCRPGECLQFGDIVVDPAARRVLKRGRPVSVTPRSFDLLLALIRREGVVVTRQELLHQVWGHPRHVLSRTVDAHVSELRRKLEDDAASPAHILTVWKIGYRFQH